MRSITRNSTLKLLLKGAKSPSKDEDVKIYWFPSLAHKVWTIRENFNDFNDFKDFDDSKDSKSDFYKFWALKRLLGPFFKNVGDFPKNVGLFLRKSDNKNYRFLKCWKFLYLQGLLRIVAALLFPFLPYFVLYFVPILSPDGKKYVFLQCKTSTKHNGT